MGEAWNPQAIIQTMTESVSPNALSTTNHLFSWPRAFPNDDYEVSVVQLDATDSELTNIVIRGVKSITSTQVRVRIQNNDGSITTDLMFIGVWTP